MHRSVGHCKGCGAEVWRQPRLPSYDSAIICPECGTDNSRAIPAPYRLRRSFNFLRKCVRLYGWRRGVRVWWPMRWKIKREIDPHARERPQKEDRWYGEKAGQPFDRIAPGVTPTLDADVVDGIRLGPDPDRA